MITRKKANKIANGFKWRKKMARVVKFWWGMRAERVAERLAQYIPENGRVLDIGSGSGNVAEELSLLSQADFTLLDVIDWNITDLPFVLFDGEKIPFGNKEFDVALLVDVLHHSEKEEVLIREAMRVAKKVIVFEEIHESGYMNVWANISDNFQWILYGMPLALHSRSEKQWADFLGKFCAKIRCEKESFGHAIFILE